MIESQYFKMTGAIIAFMACLLFTPVWYTNRDTPSANSWLCVIVTLFILLLLVVLKPVVAPLYLLLTLTALGFMLPLFILQGMLRFYAIPYQSSIITPILFVFAGILLYFNLVDNNMEMRQFVLCQYLLIVIGYCAWLGIYYHNYQSLVERVFIFFLLCICLQMVLRNIELLYPDYVNTLPNAIQIFIKFGLILASSLGLLMCFAMLLNERKQLLIIKLQHKAEREAEYRQHLLATLSHELRTPLNAIAGTAQLLKSRHDDTQLKTDCDTIIDASMSLAELASQILNFSHLVHGKNVIEKKMDDINRYLRNLILLFKPLAETKNLTLRLDIDTGNNRYYYLDWVKLQSVLINLLGNAVKFSDQGHVTLTVKLADNQNTLYFEVQDSGIGIPEADLSRLTQPFERGSNVTATEGTGLGLSIINKLLFVLDSKLHIESEKNKGSRFYFSLPITVPAQLQTELAADSRVLQGLSILLIEDNAINYKVIRAMLEQDKHQVILAKNGADAIMLSRKQAFDIILLDMRLPDMNGVDIYKTVTQDQHNPNCHTQFIAVTANLIKQDITYYREIGIQRIVSKPVSQETLRDALYRSLQNANVSLESDPTSITDLSSYPLFDPQPLTWIKENLGQTEFEQYLHTLPNILDTHITHIQEAYDQIQQDMVKHHLHRLAGSAAQAGFSRLAQSCNLLENRNIPDYSQQELTELLDLSQISIRAQQQAVEL